MTAWVELDQRCQEMGIHPDNLASKGGDAVFRTIHGLLVHSVFMRKEYGVNYLSTSLFELMHSSVAKRAVKVVQALVSSEHYASRLLVQTTCKCNH